MHCAPESAIVERLKELKSLLAEVDDLKASSSLLHWDQATYMPPGGADARGRQLATLSRLAHEKFTSNHIGQLLAELESVPSEELGEASTLSLIRVTRREYDKAVKVPAEFEARFSEHCAKTFTIWSEARPRNDFQAVRPLLEKTLDMSRELAGFFPYDHIADPLIHFSDPGMKADSIRNLFSRLRAELVPLVQSVLERGPSDTRCLRGKFPAGDQLRLVREMLTQIGYDWERGRLDTTHHPFMTKFSLGDVRITNRGAEDDVTEMIFGALHEAGHALYEQGINQEFEATPLADGASSGIHESQSRLWENLIGRSPAFWRFFYVRLQQVFPHFRSVPTDQFLAAINAVSNSLIRTDADELTYNLHVMIRFDLELQLLSGSLEVKDLPEAWTERYRMDLGITAESDVDGCLQDVHWFSGPIGGAFQGYTLGNILSAQFYDAAHKAHPKLTQDIEQGEFAPLRLWLTDKVYRHGCSKTPEQLVQDATGQALVIEPYLDYLRSKYAH